jgi:NAD(P)-dependent dehydrogenase (short-subunit alcohol dehydrogenase family)
VSYSELSGKDIESPFGKHTTAGDVLRGVNLKGKVAVVTGATAGIGKATATALARAGAEIVMGGRNAEALERARLELLTVSVDNAVHAYPLDLMSLASVDDFADKILALRRPIDILINNAGITGQLVRNDQHIESQLMTNFIGHAVLSSRLAGALARSGNARVVSLSSFGHHYSPVVFDDLNFERRPYSAWDGYGQSKTACVLLAVKLATTLRQKRIDAFAVHPGAIWTELGRNMSEDDYLLAKRRGSIPAPEDFKSPEGGAATSVWAATEPLLTGRSALYLEDCNVAPLLDTPNYRYGVMNYAMDSDNADRLWSATERLIHRALPL